MGSREGLDTGTGQAVSNKYYGGTFSVDALLIAFGWGKVLLAILVALGLFRVITLTILFVVNAFVALIVWQSVIDPFWLWMGGDKPDTVNTRSYPSIVVAAASWVLIALRQQDTLALDQMRTA